MGGVGAASRWRVVSTLRCVLLRLLLAVFGWGMHQVFLGAWLRSVGSMDIVLMVGVRVVQILLRGWFGMRGAGVSGVFVDGGFGVVGGDRLNTW